MKGIFVQETGLGNGNLESRQFWRLPRLKRLHRHGLQAERLHDMI